MILTFENFVYNSDKIDFNELGEINEGHQYSESICSVMDKLTFYVKRNLALESSNLNESAKRIYNQEIRFNRNEQIAASCIFNEMLRKFEENMKEEVAVYENIINYGQLLEEGVEYNVDQIFDQLSLNEGLKDKFKAIFQKGKEGLVNVTKNIIDKSSELVSPSVKVIKAKKDDLVAWAKEAKKDFVERYESLKKLISGIIKKGLNTVSDFINHILEVFSSIGDNLVDVVKKLGGLKMDKGETPAKLEIEGVETEGLYKNVKSDEEKSFVNNIISRVQAMLSKDKENASKLMTESYLEESIVDNKFIAWLAGYKPDGTKMSWWKTILIGLCASLIVWMLPKVLILAGVTSVVSVFIAALVASLWNIAGLLKLIYRRNKERKPGEKFFDKKTAIFFCLSIIANVISISTFVKTIAPFMQEICNTMGWTGGDDMSKFGEFIYKVTKKISPENCFQQGGLTEVSNEIQNYGGDFRSNDILKSKDDVLELLKTMPGITDSQLKTVEDFLSAPLDAQGSSAVYKALESFKDNPDLPLFNLFDTSKWGGSGPIIKALDFYKDKLGDSAILGTIGSTATQAASGGQYGFVSYITGVTQEQANMIFQKAAEFAGQDASTLQIHTYGSGIIENIITIVEPNKFLAIAPDLPVLPMVMPFFDKKQWGKYKIRFASLTRGAAGFVVEKVEMLSGDEIISFQKNNEEEPSPAFEILQKLHKNAWDEYNTLPKTEKIEEGLFHKKEKKEEKVEEPKYIVIYVSPINETGNEDDKPKDNKDEKEKEVSIGFVIDTLTMMCADMCDFQKSPKIRRRPRPYFMKGLHSRISFAPVKENDNDTKEFIRTMLGKCMKTLASQNILYGMGKKYIDAEVNGKKMNVKLRQTVLGNDKLSVNSSKTLFELGNFSPEELIQCMSDESKNNLCAYEFLDGKYATNVTIKTDDDGKIVKKVAIPDKKSIENVKYYRVSKQEYDNLWKVYNDNKKQYDEKKLEKKPTKPSLTKGEDGLYYKRASLKLQKSSDYKRKKIYDYIDIRIIPLIKKGGKLYNELSSDKKINKLLYTEDGKLNKISIKILHDYLFRPEKTFSKTDEYGLTAKLNAEGINGEKLGWFKNLFKDEEQLHDTFKRVIEKIWDYMQKNRRDRYKGKDFTPNHYQEGFENYAIYDSLIEEFYDEDYDDDNEYMYDLQILTEKKSVYSFEEFLLERY